MKRAHPAMIFGGLIILVLGLSLFLTLRSGGGGSGSFNGEFPQDWFAGGFDEELAAQSKLPGKPMPLLELTHWHNGEIKTEDLKGKIVVLDFWATWCAPCIAAIPENNEIYARYKPKGLEFIGICTNTMQENFEKIVADKKPEYPIARDEAENTRKAWSAQTYPVYVVVDRRGIVRAIGLKHEYIEKVLEKLIAEPAQ